MSDDEPLSPEEAFALFGHDLRVAMLLELADAEGRSLSFSELRERVGERDSGKFNYHLKKLVGRFVGHDDERDEYRLLYPGHHVIDVVQSGVYTERASVRAVDLDADCVHCGGGLWFDYDTINSGRVRCRDCGRILLGFPFDPGGLTDREESEVARAYDLRTRTMWQRAARDVCPVCSGRVDAAFDDDVAPKLAATHDHPVLAALDCEQCSFFVNAPVGSLLVWHPETVGFLAERGVDVRERRLWELPFVVDPAAVEIAGRDPWRVRVTVAAGDRERVATVDESLSVVGFE
ncbi:DUF7351 domain-containing protein [Halomicrobium salinisoli]|uniref:DUF7351 domain-containing protein n=1 Tax=Halomicrobium salinisoli TaxID=2878391 RepID=UPI001CF0703B|nr:hypothetical protein [Halomicrobium salinisoli]